MLLVLALAGCSTPRTRDPGYHHVLAGDTLYSIAFHYGLDYQDVARWNGIGPPYDIYPGQRLSLIPTGQQELEPLPYYSKPVEDRVVNRTAGDLDPPDPGAGSVSPKPPPESRPEPTPSSRPARVARAEPQPVPKPRPVPKRPASPSPAVEKAKKSPQPVEYKDPSRWLWPTEGDVVTRFSPGHGKKGIDIRGRFGQGVVAVADGEVVYSGKGLIGYGNLIIIKHSRSYLSAYGHNRRLLVKEGESVRAGQKIAEMGQTAKTGSILHFEIRKSGKPVDPVGLLPTKN